MSYDRMLLSVHQVDIWNIIEAVRENGLTSAETQVDITLSRLEALLGTVFTQLNKRLPPAQHVNVEQCCSLALSWLLSAYDR